MISENVITEEWMTQYKSWYKNLSKMQRNTEKENLNFSETLISAKKNLVEKIEKDEKKKETV